MSVDELKRSCKMRGPVGGCRVERSAVRHDGFDGWLTKRNDAVRCAARLDGRFERRRFGRIGKQQKDSRTGVDVHENCCIVCGSLGHFGDEDGTRR